MQDQFRTGSVTVDRMKAATYFKEISYRLLGIKPFENQQESPTNASSFWRILYIGTVRQKCVMK